MLENREIPIFEGKWGQFHISMDLWIFTADQKVPKERTIVWATSFFYYGLQKCFLLYRLKAVKNSFTMKLTLDQASFFIGSVSYCWIFYH